MTMGSCPEVRECLGAQGKVKGNQFYGVEDDLSKTLSMCRAGRDAKTPVSIGLEETDGC